MIEVIIHPMPRGLCRVEWRGATLVRRTATPLHAAARALLAMGHTGPLATRRAGSPHQAMRGDIEALAPWTVSDEDQRGLRLIRYRDSLAALHDTCGPESETCPPKSPATNTAPRDATPEINRRSPHDDASPRPVRRRRPLPGNDGLPGAADQGAPSGGAKGKPASKPKRATRGPGAEMEGGAGAKAPGKLGTRKDNQ